MPSDKKKIIIGVSAVVLALLGLVLYIFARPTQLVNEEADALQLDEPAFSTSLAETPRPVAELTPGQDEVHSMTAPAEDEEIPDEWEAAELTEQEKAMLAKDTDNSEPVHIEEAEDTKVASAPKQAKAGNQKKKATGSSVKHSPGEERNNKKFDVEINYKMLVKNPAKLGFVPDEKLFREVYFQIRSSFVEQVSDEKLFQGVKNEVAKLLKVAKVSTSDLNRLDKRRNVLTQINEFYKGKVDSRILNYAAIEGMLIALNDAYSVMMPPEDYASLQEQVQTKGFGGIGVYIEADKDAGNQVTIFEPIEGTPAYLAGLEPGDQILAIDGKSTKGMDLAIATGLIRGTVGTKVVLKIRRHDNPNPFNVSVTRNDIHVVSATSKIVGGDIGYIRLRQFGTMSIKEFGAELSKMQSKGVRGIIVDLRNNGGGYIDAAVGIVGMFTPERSLVVYTLDRNKSRHDYRSKTAGNVRVPVVVMINRYSASASEITAGALRDHGVAKLVGEKSFGKGSVQQVFPFSDNSALKLTIARFYSPKGHVIDHKGLEADYTVEMEPRFVGKGGKDTQMQKAISVLHGMNR